MHIAQIGTGRVGRPTAYTIMISKLADKLTVCDVKPKLAAAFAEELKHVSVSEGIDTEICSCEESEKVTGADIILISAGQPRIPGINMTRRDLVAENAKIVKKISEVTTPNNPQAKYVVITNPVDAMAMVCKKYTGADFVIGTGTNLESLRFRSKLAETFGVPKSKVTGWVGGEHGDLAIPLWSTTKISGLEPESYANNQNKEFSKEEITTYVKDVSKVIVDNIGGTEYGPAASFRDIVRAIVNNTNEILSISTPMILEENEEIAYVGTPIHLGKKYSSSIYSNLTTIEQEGIKQAAKAIKNTFKNAVECVN